MSNWRIEELKTAIYELDEHEGVSIYNALCDAVSYCDDRIYMMDEFNDIMCGKSPIGVAEALDDGNFRTYDCYFMFNGCGYLESFDDPTDIIINMVEENLKYAMDDKYFRGELEYYLDLSEFEEEEEEEEEDENKG